MKNFKSKIYMPVYKDLNISIKFLLTPLILFFLLFSVHLQAATHTYVPSEDSPITLTSTGYTDNTHDSSKNAYVYYMFQLDEAGDVTITVNNIGTENVSFNSSLTDYPSPPPSNAIGDTTLDINGLAENDTIYIAISSTNNSAKSFGIVVTLTPVPDSNLTITKTNSADIVTIDEDFYYTINVKNIGSVAATNVIMTDILPTGMIFDENETDTNSPNWNCGESSQTVTCNHQSSIGAGETHTILLHVTAPSTAGDINNTASVIGSINGTSHSDSATETTVISAEINNAEDLCYIDTTIDNYASEAARDADCDKEGNFYYGKDCIASVLIVDNNISANNLTDVIVTKMYAPGLDHGQATVTRGILESSLTDTGGPSTLTINEFTSYTEGYVVRNLDADGFVNDANFTITDTGSYNNGNKMYGIALHGDYSVDGAHHSGRIYACSGGEGGIEILSNVDIIDTPIADATDATNYNNSVVPSVSATDIKFIRTMIADDNTREMVGVYLDINDESAVYDYNGSGNTLLPYKITPIWSDSTCSTYLGNVIDPATNQQLIIEIPSGSYSGVGTAYVPNEVGKDLRLQMIAIDPNALSVEGQNCLDGSTTGNFLQLAQCVNSEVQYKTAFGQDAWDRCGIDSGRPCLSSNHGEADPSDPSYNPDEDFIYLSELGCYMCTFNIQPTCSSDNFAIRPKAFDVNISDGDIFVSGENINLKFEAINWNDTTETYDYNESEGSSFDVNTTLTDLSKDCQVSVDLMPSVNFTDGIDDGVFFFNDVGSDLNFTVSEINGSEYAFVDVDDTNDSLRFITPFERNISVIPDRFNIDVNLTDHNTDSNFTYLHDINRYDGDDNYEMGVTLSIDIQAVGADDNITRNYMETCYAKDTNVTLALNSTNITYPGTTQALTHFLYYNPVEDDGSPDAGEGNTTLPAPVGNTITISSLPIENVPSSFSADAPDGNGTASIEYILNFDRKQNLPVNPFKLIVNDVNITEVDTSVATSDLVTGTTGTLTDENATMYYARSRASMFFYEDITTAAVNTPILVDIYCDQAISTCATLGIDTVNGRITDFNPQWWLSLGHNESTHNDGNITLFRGAIIEGGGNPAVDTDVTIDTQAQDSSITVTSNASGNQLPMTVLIELDESNPTDTNHWLIYNEDDAILTPSPFYKVRFIGDSAWTGTGITGNVADVNASRKKSKRMDW